MGTRVMKYPEFPKKAGYPGIPGIRIWVVRFLVVVVITITPQIWIHGVGQRLSDHYDRHLVRACPDYKSGQFNTAFMETFNMSDL